MDGVKIKISGGDLFTAKLGELEAKLGRRPEVRVGFMAKSTYPDGTSVPMVAAANEFGDSTVGRPPRPFFRRMIDEKGKTWPNAVALQLKATDYNVAKTMDRMGQGIKGQLQQSIVDLVSPPLAKSTVDRKGFDKPLIETSNMLNSVDYEVIE